MNAIQRIWDDNNTIGGKCAQMGELLGLTGPVKEAVLMAAFYDESYAHNLLVCRRDSEMLMFLLANPPAMHAHKPQTEEKKTTELIGKLSSAVWRWAKTGFSTVDEAMLDKRLQSCMTCPNLAGKPESLLYKALSGNNEDPICRICGCVVSKKTRLTSENCPDPHPQMPGVSRWEEAF